MKRVMPRIFDLAQAKTVVPLALGLALLTAWPLPSQAVQVVEWHNVPISIVLTVGEERALAFPDNVQVGVPASLPQDVFRTESTAGTVLWLARRPFETERLQVRLLSTGRVMLFDVTAVEAKGAPNGSAEPIQVTFPETVSDPKAAAGGQGLTPIDLTRFAAQELYAPLRVLHDMPGIRRVPMGASETVRVYRDPDVLARPLGSWQGGGLYVTAVELTNLGTARVILDPRLLEGRFLTATFQHNTLGPAKSRLETTCVYLVTDRPFGASITHAPPAAPPVPRPGD